MEEKNSKRKGALFAKIAVVLILIIAIVLALLFSSKHSNKSQITKLGFDDIGELATQAAYATEVNVTESSRNLFGVNIPFTQSKLIYSYDVAVKAGYNFAEISADADSENKIINVYLPEAKIISTELDLDSFKIYHEKESIFRPVTMEENNEALKNMENDARENAVENGILEMARTNAESLLTGFIGNMYDLDVYQIRFNNAA